MCVCNASFKDEPSCRNHFNTHHRLIQELVCQFSELASIGRKLTEIDFSFLGDTTPREIWSELLGPIENQKLRLMKFLALRQLIKYSTFTQHFSAIDK